ncbi:MAG: hypothetical protein KIT33_07160 [Candidatus Kapabacteria bacterium]|nr:hypothetical protein [Ignavibacteriota bacterium]MCW5884733.1 hypothetical protein [Candidatus Kapabacteria bacterium]
MSSEIIYTEKQRFTQIWIWAFIIGLNAFSVWALIQQLYYGNPVGNNPASDVGLIIITSVTFLFTLLIAVVKLDTRIEKSGIYVRLFPFHLEFKFYPWNIISKSYVREYRPIVEYGGWGLRGFQQNRAFNTSGNQGLQLVFNDNKKLLIGTNKPTELAEILNSIGKLKM